MDPRDFQPPSLQDDLEFPPMHGSDDYYTDNSLESLGFGVVCFGSPPKKKWRLDSDFNFSEPSTSGNLFADHGLPFQFVTNGDDSPEEGEISDDGELKVSHRHIKPVNSEWNIDNCLSDLNTSDTDPSCNSMGLVPTINSNLLPTVDSMNVVAPTINSNFLVPEINSDLLTPSTAAGELSSAIDVTELASAIDVNELTSTINVNELTSAIDVNELTSTVDVNVLDPPTVDVSVLAPATDVNPPTQSSVLDPKRESCENSLIDNFDLLANVSMGSSGCENEMQECALLDKTDDANDDENEDDGDEGEEMEEQGEENYVEGEGHDFQVIDDLCSDDDMDDDDDNDNDQYSDESEEYLNDDEIDSMLDHGVPKIQRLKNKIGKEVLTSKMLLPMDDEDFMVPNVREKILLVEKGHDPFDILPEGWLMITHLSGMPIYLHRKTRVCTVSRPYFLGPGSARRHDIPVSAVPCLHYKRAMNPESTVPSSTSLKEDEDGEMPSDDTMPSEIMAAPSESMATDDTGVAADLKEQPTSSETTVKNDTGEMRPPVGTAKVQSVEEHKRINSLKPLDFREYCEKLFEFQTITVRRFRRWKDRRKHNIMLKKASRPALPPSTKLITCPITSEKVSASGHAFKRKEFVLNPANKSAICILHEYAQHAMKVQPQYQFNELENSQTPYSATVVINDIQYGTGYASSKKSAKLEAARVTLEILIPEINRGEKPEEKHVLQDLSFFDEIKIEDPRVVDLCNKAGQPTPFQILCECLKRNYGMGDTQVQMEINTVKRQRSEFIMRVGKHEAKVICKNKREGKQQASQAILQLMHPHIRTWGSLLRLYAKGSEVKEKREEEQSVTELQTKAQPNKAILSKLHQEMTKLYQKRDSLNMNVKGKFRFEGHTIRSAELGSVDL